jgi:hypothetical protein
LSPSSTRFLPRAADFGAIVFFAIVVEATVG